MAVFAWALAIYGRPSVPAAAKPSVVPSTERRLMFAMAAFLSLLNGALATRPYYSRYNAKPNVRLGHMKDRLAILNFWCELRVQNGAILVYMLVSPTRPEMCHAC